MLLPPQSNEGNSEDWEASSQSEDGLFDLYRKDIIHRTYLETADATYITARWQFMNSLPFEYLWNSLHALEKYLKACLLINHIEISNLNHNIVAAFDLAQEKFGEALLPTAWPEPLTKRIEHILSGDLRRRLQSSGPRDFIKRLEAQGGTDARYALKSHVINTTDLYCLDLTAFQVRRLVTDLSVEKNKNQLIDEPQLCPWKYSFLEKVLCDDDHKLRETLSDCNYFLVSKPDTSVALRVSLFGRTAANSALYNHIVENAESNNPVRAAVSKRLADWVINYLPANRKIKAALKEYI